MRITNIAATVDRMAEQKPYAQAIVYPHGRDKNGRVSYTHLTFKQLAETSGLIARGLERYGITRGMRAVLMVTPSLEFFALTFAMLRAGIVPVMIDPGIDRRSLKTCLAEAEPEAFIGIPKAHLARVLLGWARETIRLNVTVGRRGPWGGVTLEQIKALGEDGAGYPTIQPEPDEMAAILFTSGSTGIPKGAIYTHGNFVAQVEMIREIYQAEEGGTNLPTFPLFALFDPALGMRSMIPDMDATRPAEVDPRKIIEAVENFGVTHMFGSPALLNTVSRYGAQHGIKLPTLKRVLSAGAPVPADVMARFVEMLPPGAQVITPYGATETLPVSAVSSREILEETRFKTDEGAGVCIGKPVPPAEVHIIPISDEPITEWDDSLSLPQGEIGEITVKSPTVTPGYYNRDRQTQLAKINREDGGIMHRMGDLGYFDAEGRLWFCGRKSHRVETGNGPLFTIPTEAVFNTHPAVYRTGLVGVQVNGRTRPVLCVELEKDARRSDRDQIVKELRELGSRRPHTRVIETFLFHPKFPVDIRHNSKIFREKLRTWAQKELDR